MIRIRFRRNVQILVCGPALCRVGGRRKAHAVAIATATAISQPVTIAATIILLFLIGYSSQRSGVCMVRAVREVIERRRVHRLAGFLLAAASAMLVMAAAKAIGAMPFQTIIGAKINALGVLGGVLFGLGTRLNGHCAIGTLAALTAGRLSQLAALAAMFIAALAVGPAMSRAALTLPPRTPLVSPLASNLTLAVAVGSVMAILAATYIYRRIGWRRPRGGWSPLVAMGLIGAASGILFALDQKWVYTSRIADAANGEVPVSWPAAAGPIALIAGMTIAAVLGGMFRMQRGSLRDWLTASGGGFLMGIGATLVPGGNDTMLFTGVPLLLPNMLVAYAAFTLTLFVALLARKRPITEIRAS